MKFRAPSSSSLEEVVVKDNTIFNVMSLSLFDMYVDKKSAELV